MLLVALITFCAALLSMCPGCSDAITVEYAVSSAKPGPLDTYRWMPTPADKTRDPRLTSDFDEVIRQAVDKELAEKGYTLTTSPDASFQVADHVVINEAVETQVIDDYLDYSEDSRVQFYIGDEAPATKTVKRKYEEGSLILDFSIPGKACCLYWRGTASTEIRPNQPQAKRDERLRKAVKLILQKFPSKK